MKIVYILFGLFVIFIERCHSKVNIPESNKINSFISANCFNGNSIIKNTNSISNCKTDITIAVDSSSDTLLPVLFSDYELSIIQNNITSNWNDFSNVNLVWYSGQPSVLMTIGTMDTRFTFDVALSKIVQKGGSNLNLLLKNLIDVDVTEGNSLSTYIFIAQYDDSDKLTTHQYVQTLKKRGSLNFIILGNVVQAQDLEVLQPSNIFYWNFDPICIPLVVNFFEASLSCNN